MDAITIIPPSSPTVAAAPRVVFFPDLDAARQSVLDYIATLPSSRSTTTTTATMSTLTTYKAALDDFIDWLTISQSFPDKPALLRYMALLAGNLSTSTISKRLAAVRLFLSYLSEQPIHPRTPDYNAVHELRDGVRLAAKIKNPKPERASHTSPIQAAGVWLKQHQIKDWLSILPRATLRGKQDRALLITGFLTGLRRAELARLTLAHFDTTSPRTHILKNLQGKRSNTDDIPVPVEVYDSIKEYVTAFNDGLPVTDPRNIHPNTPIWRQLSRSGNRLKASTDLGEYGIARRVNALYTLYRQHLDPQYQRATDPKPFTCHDMRRSFVLNAYLAGMPPDLIIRVTRHKSLDMFMKYVGKLLDYESINVAEYGYNITG